jgi:hypothetical protein
MPHHHHHVPFLGESATSPALVIFVGDLRLLHFEQGMINRCLLLNTFSLAGEAKEGTTYVVLRQM